MKLALVEAHAQDARAIADLRNAAADALTRGFGKGPWSGQTSERGVIFGMTIGKVYIARRRGAIAGTLQLQTRKPWAIDTSYFKPCERPLYLVSMAVHPRQQRKGIGRAMLMGAALMAREWPADSIRLDSYDADAGAGLFYAKCGYHEVARVVYRGTPLIYYELRFDA